MCVRWAILRAMVLVSAHQLVNHQVNLVLNLRRVLAFQQDSHPANLVGNLVHNHRAHPLRLRQNLRLQLDNLVVNLQRNLVVSRQINLVVNLVANLVVNQVANPQVNHLHYHRVNHLLYHRVSLLGSQPHNQRTQHVAPMLGARMAIFVTATIFARLVLLGFGALVGRTHANPVFLVPIRW